MQRIYRHPLAYWAHVHKTNSAEVDTVQLFQRFTSIVAIATECHDARASLIVLKLVEYFRFDPYFD
jgi:hypothetical protein